jgi:hypothetical protein
MAKLVSAAMGMKGLKPISDEESVSEYSKGKMSVSCSGPKLDEKTGLSTSAS